MEPDSPTSASWGIEFIIAQELVEDAPVLDMAISHYVERAREDAAAAGVELYGDPRVDYEPGAWVDNWRDGVGSIVGMDVAFLCGVTEPTVRRYRIVWLPVVKVAT